MLNNGDVMKTYVIYGNPTPLARPRLAHNHIYDSQANQKVVASIDIKNQQADTPFLTGPLHLSVTFFMKTPESISLKKKEALYGKYHIVKPDISNMIKYIEDIATGIIYNDDCLIASIDSKKVYDAIPRTQFTLKEIKI